MKSNPIVIAVLSALVLIGSLTTGYVLAKDKPLWNDEIHTQVSSIHRSNAAQMLKGDLGEGSVSPLFYLIQRNFTLAFGYEMPEQWEKGDFEHKDAFSQIFLRVNPVLFMSLALMMIFYFFGKYYSLGAAFYALLVCLSSYMIWVYWAEARPYALLFFGITLQLIFFLRLFLDEKGGGLSWLGLTLTHFLLAFTSTTSILSIVTVSLVLWLFYERRWFSYLLTTVIPVAVIMYYWWKTPKFGFYFVDSPYQVVGASFPLDRILIVGVFALALLLYLIQKKYPKFALFSPAGFAGGGPLLVQTLLIGGATAGLLYYLRINEVLPSEAQNISTFQVSARYFIFLAPYAVMAATVFPVLLFRALKGKMILRVILILGIAFLLGFRFWRTFSLVSGLYPGLFS